MDTMATVMQNIVYTTKTVLSSICAVKHTKLNGENFNVNFK